MTKMTLEQVRDWHRVVASENAERRALCSPNGERWELWNDEFNKQVAMADAIDAHLAKGAQVPDERVYAPLPSDADEYDRGHVDGWNACRKAMLSQRGEVE